MKACGCSRDRSETTSSKISSPSDGFVPEQSSSRITIAPGPSSSKSARMRSSSIPRRTSLRAALALVGLGLLEERDHQARHRHEPRLPGGHEAPHLRQELGEPERLEEP